MGGSSVTDDLEVTTNEAGTLVLLGSPGTSKYSSSGVTSTCELQSTRLDDGLTVNVIYTPGLFDFSGEPEVIGKEVTTNEARTLVLLGRTGLFDFSGEHEVIGKEIVKCMDLAKDGIHAVLLVLSVRTRFSREEQAAIQSFQEFFGEKIRDYMVFVFTGGDELEDNDQSLDDYLGNECPEPLKETIKMCDNRLVLFDNKTKDPKKKTDQLIEVLSLVNLVLEKNGGVPYTNELFKELQALKANSLIGDSKHMIDELKEPVPRSYEEQLSRLTENVESKPREMRHLEAELEKERAPQLEAEQNAEATLMNVEDMSSLLKESLEGKRLRVAEELQARKLAFPTGMCHIL
ncbi:hypothetical protein K7X08_004248 [Anisodus acutangulus]|uniref:AIG1-type G domain-containing protein n=1 Tax=Anisodus acutangulus TaxID=402998 RepID=A0A9Q1RK50_9SOLA|nr:hypothetical protein K7X08_004248 [Anisodus acutangulus]